MFTLEIKKEYSFKNQRPLYINGTTFIPLREVLESLSAELQWEASQRKITVFKGHNTVELQIGNTKTFVNKKEIQLNDAPYIDPYSESSMVPLRLLSEALEYQVDWDQETQSVHIHTLADDTVYNELKDLFTKHYKALKEKDLDQYLTTIDKDFYEYDWLTEQNGWDALLKNSYVNGIDKFLELRVIEYNSETAKALVYINDGTNDVRLLFDLKKSDKSWGIIDFIFHS